MKEMERKLNNLTREPQTPYSKGGDIFMAEPEQGDQPPRRISQEQVNRRLDEATRARRESQTAAGGGGKEPPPAPPIPPEEPDNQEGDGSEGQRLTRHIIDVTGLKSKEALSLANQINLLKSNFLNERILEDFYKEVIKLPASSDRQALLNSLQVARREIGEEEVRRMEIAEGRRLGTVLNLQENQIQDPILKGYVPEINSLIDEIRKGQLDDEKYQALYNKINALLPPDSYGAIPSSDDEASRAEARIREAKMDAFDFSKQALKSAMSQARRNLMSSGREEGEGAEGKVITKLVEAIKNEDYDGIDETIRNSGFNPGDQRGIYGEVIVRAAELAERMGDRDHMVEYLLEYGLERIISRADENPSDSYPQFNLYESYNIDNIIQAARKYDEKKPRGERGMFGYLTNLQYKRRAMHDLFQGMKDRKTYVSLVTQLLRRNGLDFVEHKIAGVADVQMMYEQVLGSRLSFKKDWLNHQDFIDADAEVMGMLMEYKGKESESLRKEYKRNGETRFRSLREWEIQRAGMVGRSLNTATERRITYGVMGDLPANTDERLRSLEFEFIARTLAPLKLVPEKFFDQPVARRYFEILHEELSMKDGRKSLHKYGYVDGSGEERGLYGKTPKAMAILDTGITDFRSNSWRGRLLLLKNKDYLTPDGRSIMDYLDHVREEVREEYKHKIKIQKPNITDLELETLMNSERHPSYKKAIDNEFNKRVAGQVKNQRLFLGALARNAGLDSYANEQGNTVSNKEEIWKNVARFLPSRIAAFLPEETLDIVGLQYGLKKPPTENKEEMKYWKQQVTERWNKFKVKLFRIERARVKRDSIALKVNGDGQTKEISDFFDSENLDPNERELVKQLRKLGEDHAEQFSQISFAFTPFLDDVPETDWNNLEDNDLDRLVINDHSNFEEGWGKITGLLANPAAKPEDIIKAFTEAFHGIASPLGIREGQKKLEPFINAYMRFSRVNNWAKYFGTIMKLGRSPRSEAEKYNLQSQIAIDEQNQAQILDSLTQHDVMSDDPTEADKNGKTQLQRVKEKNKLDLLAIIMMQFRVIAMLFGPVFALELFKSILPPDMAKALG